MFHFLTDRADHDAYVAALMAATGPGTVVIMGTFAPDGPERCSCLPVQGYSPKTLQLRLGNAFELTSSRRHAHTTPGGAEQRFTFAVFRRV